MVSNEFFWGFAFAFFWGGEAGSNSLLIHGFYIFHVFLSIALVFERFILYISWPKPKISFLPRNTYLCFRSSCPLSHIQLKVTYSWQVLSREGLGIRERGDRISTTTPALLFPLEIRNNAIQLQVANPGKSLLTSYLSYWIVFLDQVLTSVSTPNN